jgi:hypothetical protein
VGVVRMAFIIIFDYYRIYPMVFHVSLVFTFIIIVL